MGLRGSPRFLLILGGTLRQPHRVWQLFGLEQRGHQPSFSRKREEERGSSGSHVPSKQKQMVLGSAFWGS